MRRWLVGSTPKLSDHFFKTFCHRIDIQDVSKIWKQFLMLIFFLSKMILMNFQCLIMKNFLFVTKVTSLDSGITIKAKYRAIDHSGNKEFTILTDVMKAGLVPVLILDFCTRNFTFFRFLYYLVEKISSIELRIKFQVK